MTTEREYKKLNQPSLSLGLNVIEGQGARFRSSFRTLAAELPTRSTARSNSSRVTPKCFIQYLTSFSLVTVILLRSGITLFVKLCRTELLHCAQICWSRTVNGPSARHFPRRAITIDLVYFLLRVWRQSLLVCIHASRGTEPHVPVAMYTKSQIPTAVIAA